MRKSRLIVLSLAASLLLVGSASASEPVLVDQDWQESGPYRIDATCSAILGVITGFNELTYAVEAEATARDERWTTFGTSQPNRLELPEVRILEAPSVATSVLCDVVNTDTDHVYGTVAGGLPGPMAVAVGEVTVPTNVHVSARVCGSAVFVNGDFVSTCAQVDA